jgi:hypothetical protein
MKKIILLFLVGMWFSTNAQIDRDQLALDISKADAANNEQLKNFIWKRHSVTFVEGKEKLITVTEFSFNEKGEIQAKMIDAKTTVKQKPGIRGAIQQNAAEDKMEYVQKALELSLAYSFMTKGQLIDFFSKAEITEKDGIIEATAKDVNVKGDKLTIQVESATKLFLNKKFSSFLGEDPVDGVFEYAKFSSGISHGSNSVLNLPSKNAVIKSENKDYSQRVQ